MKIQDTDNDVRLDRWLRRTYPNLTQGMIEKFIRKGDIRVDGKRCKSNHRVMSGQEIKIPPFISNSVVSAIESAGSGNSCDINLGKLLADRVIYKDQDIIAINKPHGVAVQGGSGLKTSIDDALSFLAKAIGVKGALKLVHRLDKDTSGVLLLAIDHASAANLTKNFHDKSIEKTYLALVVGVPTQKKGVIKLLMAKGTDKHSKEKMMVTKDGQESETHYKVIRAFGTNVSLVELRPLTGRTHQLRLHMAEIGTPIVGDGKYGGRNAHIEGLGNKLHLHAKSIKIPNDSDYIVIDADLPKHFVDSINKLDKR